MIWIRQPKENPGRYFFSGQFYITNGVSESLSLEEITTICLDLKSFENEQDGIDYLQVHECTNGRKVWFIDQLDADMIASGEFKPEANHCTLAFA